MARNNNMTRTRKVLNNEFIIEKGDQCETMMRKRWRMKPVTME